MEKNPTGMHQTAIRIFIFSGLFNTRHPAEAFSPAQAHANADKPNASLKSFLTSFFTLPSCY